MLKHAKTKNLVNIVGYNVKYGKSLQNTLYTTTPLTRRQRGDGGGNGGCGAR